MLPLTKKHKTFTLIPKESNHHEDKPHREHIHNRLDVTLHIPKRYLEHYHKHTSGHNNLRTAILQANESMTNISRNVIMIQ